MRHISVALILMALTACSAPDKGEVVDKFARSCRAEQVSITLTVGTWGDSLSVECIEPTAGSKTQ